MKRFFKTTLSTLIVFALFAVSVNAKESNSPAMWQLSDDDTVVYLFGTVHVLSPDTVWKTDYLEQALRETNITYLEADVSSPEAMTEMQQAIGLYGLNLSGLSLSSTLGEPLAQQFSSAAENLGVPMEQLEPLKPWLASLTLMVTAMHKMGLSENSGADMAIENIARAEQDEIRFLESGTSQIVAMASLDEAEDYAFLKDMLAQLQDFEREMYSMIDVWQKGDTQALYAQLVEDLKDISEQGYELLIVKRNENWVEQITKLMAGEGNYFIAVGAGHLVGDESVVAMLKAKGFNVERVQ